MNLQDRELELNFREITCKRSVNDAVFAQGVQDFDFSVSGKHAFIPSLSYFVIKTKLSVAVRDLPINQGASPVSPGGTALSPRIWRVPYRSDEIALADHFGSTLYNNCFFRAGNSDVSTISQYIPQAALLKSRLDKSGAWSKYCGRDLMIDEPDFTRRLNKVCLDGTFHEDGLDVGAANDRILLNSSGAKVPITNISLGVSGSVPFSYNSTTQVFTFLDPGSPSLQIDAFVSAIAPGDILETYHQVSTGPIVSEIWSFKVINVLTATTVLVELLNQPQGTISTILPPGPFTSYLRSCKAPADPRCGFNEMQVIFQPPLGIFSTVNPISGGDFKITLNPNPNYKVAGVQSNFNLIPEVDYNLEIREVLFYACQIRADVSPTGIIPLSLLEMSVLNKSLSGGAPGGSQNIDFTVPPSTLALTVFVQTTRCGSSTLYSPTQFIALGKQGSGAIEYPQSTGNNNIVNNIQYIQVTYGSVTKTQTLYPSKYEPLTDTATGSKTEVLKTTRDITASGINYNIQRWLQSIQYSGKITSEGGTESDQNFLDRGNYWHFDFSRDKNDTSSYVNVQISFNNYGDAAIDSSDQLFLVAHYSRQAEIQYENGFITQVISVNR